MALKGSGPGREVNGGMEGGALAEEEEWGVGGLWKALDWPVWPLCWLPLQTLPCLPVAPPPHLLLTEVLRQECTGTTCRGRARGPGLLPSLLLRPQVPPPGNLQRLLPGTCHPAGSRSELCVCAVTGCGGVGGRVAAVRRHLGKA